MANEVRAWRQLHHPVWLYRLVQRAGSLPVRLAFNTSLSGIEKIPPSGPVILAANHASNLDPLLVVACVRRPLFHLGKHTLFTNRLARLSFETLGGQIAVNRERGGNESSLAAGLEVLARGLALGIYPEGTRSLDGKLQRGRTGVALFAFLTGAPVFPIAIRGTFRAMPPGRAIPRFFSPTSVTVGDPFRVAREPEAANNSRRCREFTDAVMTGIASLLGLPYPRARLSGSSSPAGTGVR